MAAARSRSSLILILLLVIPNVLVLAALSGCGSDNPSCVGGTGRIAGTIRTVGPYQQATVAAQGVRSGPFYHSKTDSSGSYVLMVQPGDYQVSLGLGNEVLVLTADGFANFGSERPPRIISVGRNQEVRIDADFGSAAVTLATPPEMEGMPIDVVLKGLAWFGYAYDTVSGGQARFSFPVVPPEDYTLGVHIKSSHYFYLPGSYRSSEAQAFRVTAGSEATIGGSLPAPGWISGTITGAWQEVGAIPHIELAAEPDSIIVAGMSAASQDGSFSLLIFAPIRGRISVEIGSDRWYGGPTFASATLVEGTPGETTQLDLRDSGIALRFEGDWDVLHLSDASRHPLRAQAFPISAGMVWLFLNLEPSTYYLKVDGKEGAWLDQWFDQADSANATPIDVPEGQLRTIDLHLQTGGRIEGRVLAGDGSPVFVAGVSLFRSSHEVTYQVAAEDGSYSLTGFGDGDYKVLATYYQQSLWYPGVADSADATAISIRGMNTVSGVDIHFPE